MPDPVKSALFPSLSVGTVCAELVLTIVIPALASTPIIEIVSNATSFWSPSATPTRILLFVNGEEGIE